jgi:hypothetical protein
MRAIRSSLLLLLHNMPRAFLCLFNEPVNDNHDIATLFNLEDQLTICYILN